MNMQVSRASLTGGTGQCERCHANRSMGLPRDTIPQTFKALRGREEVLALVTLKRASTSSFITGQFLQLRA